MLSRDASIWAIRLFLGREPNDEAEIDLHRNHADLLSLRTGFAMTHEVRNFVQGLLAPPQYRAPLFLLRPPQDAALPWHFEPPSLAAPVCQLCTETQVTGRIYHDWCHALGLAPNPHRKTWEFAWIAAVMQAGGILRPGARALGFGVGREPLPAFLAAQGLSVMATDAPPEIGTAQGWDSTNQFAAGLDSLLRPGLVEDALLRERVAFRSVDMNAIPEDLRGFDACWSACALEHLGSVEHGLHFIAESLRTLRPGGLAIHTTEFNLDSDEETIDLPDLCLFRRSDIERVLSHLIAAGHRAWPLNLHPGTGEFDRHIDLPPYALPHLKLQVAQFATTSIGIVVEKGG